MVPTRSKGLGPNQIRSVLVWRILAMIHPDIETPAAPVVDHQVAFSLVASVELQNDLFIDPPCFLLRPEANLHALDRRPPGSLLRLGRRFGGQDLDLDRIAHHVHRLTTPTEPMGAHDLLKSTHDLSSIGWEGAEPISCTQHVLAWGQCPQASGCGLLGINRELINHFPYVVRGGISRNAKHCVAVAPQQLGTLVLMPLAIDLDLPVFGGAGGIRVPRVVTAQVGEQLGHRSCRPSSLLSPDAAL